MKGEPRQSRCRITTSWTVWRRTSCSVLTITGQRDELPRTCSPIKNNLIWLNSTFCQFMPAFRWGKVGIRGKPLTSSCLQLPQKAWLLWCYLSNNTLFYLFFFFILVLDRKMLIKWQPTTLLQRLSHALFTEYLVGGGITSQRGQLV